MKTVEEIETRIKIIEKINNSDIDLLKDEIPEQYFETIQIAGEEWPLLRGYTNTAIDALKFTLSKNEKILTELQSQYSGYMEEIRNGSVKRTINPHLIIERYNALSWVLDKCEWGRDEI